MDDVQVQPISRRRMLKRVGVGTAIAWSTPIISSIRMPAYAQGSPLCSPTFCGPNFDFCDPGAPVCPLPLGCPAAICSVMNDNSCICWDFAFCTCPTPVCQSDADCGPGFKCGPTEPDCESCCGRVACYHPCGLSGAAPKQRQGLKVVRASDIRR
jgi:hypothetical protein